MKNGKSKKASSSEKTPYLHGFSEVEQDRLRRQARLGEHFLYQNVNFSSAKHILEVGCGVGAQTEILLRRFPELRVSGIDVSEKQLQAAEDFLSSIAYTKGRYDLKKMDASKLTFATGSFDGAFISWVLEHVPDPERVLNEVRRVLKPGSTVVVNEVMNFTFFLEPYSPNVWKYWMAYNDYQIDEAKGDPFVGAKLGNFLLAQGFRNIETEVKVRHLDNREPGRRRDFIAYFSGLLLSAAERLIKKGVVSKELVARAEKELDQVAHDPNATLFFAFMQARALI